jgi:hypothetical protein
MAAAWLRLEVFFQARRVQGKARKNLRLLRHAGPSAGQARMAQVSRDLWLRYAEERHPAPARFCRRAYNPLRWTCRHVRDARRTSDDC